MPNLAQIASAGALPGFGATAPGSGGFGGLAAQPYLPAPQVSMSNPVGAPSQGLFDRMRYNFAGMDPFEKMKMFGGLGQGLGGFQGQGFDEIAPMLQRLRRAGLAGPGAGGGAPAGAFGAGGASPFGAFPMSAQPPTAPRGFPTPPVTPGNATAPQLISRLGNQASQIRNRLGGF